MSQLDIYTRFFVVYCMRLIGLSTMTNYSTANSKKVVLRKSQTLNSKAQRVMSNFFLGLLIGKITLVHPCALNLRD